MSGPLVENADESAHLLEDCESLPEKYPEAAVVEGRVRATLVRQLTIVASGATLWCRARAQAISFNDIFRGLLCIVIPSFLRKSTSSPTATARNIPSHAHLDGLRGLAALFVFFFHSSYTMWDVRAGYRSGKKDQYTSILRLPILNLLYQGDAMVSIFYIISGFVLSMKPIKLMRLSSYDTLFLSTSSSIFRRGVRLFLPCFASTFIILLALRLGLYEIPREMTTDRSVFGGELEWHMFRTETFWQQLWDWIRESFNFIHVWEWNNIYAGNTGYDVHLWTIPVEYRCSILLFLTHIVLARASFRARTGSLLGLIVFAIIWDRWDMTCFWSGALLAELDLMRLAALPATTTTTFLSTQSSLRMRKLLTCAWYAVFVIGLYLLSFPGLNPHKTWGYQTLFALVPTTLSQKNRFWHIIGGCMIVQAINALKVLQRFFNCHIIMYLGKISFALYLMHGLILHTFGYTVLPVMLDFVGRDTKTSFGLGWFMNQCLVTVVVIWASDIFWQNVEIPSVTFCKWLENCFFRKT